MNDAPEGYEPNEFPQDNPPRLSLEKAVEQLINSYSGENDSNTPDFILAGYLMGCLQVFNHATNKREAWYGRRGKYDGVGEDRPAKEGELTGADGRNGLLVSSSFRDDK